MDKNPAPEGFEGTCLQCGRPLTGMTTSYHVPTYGGVTVTARFCSEECAKAYKTYVNEYWEEFEDIERAGAT